MKPTPPISDAEWDVMNVIWAESPITAGQVVAALQSRRQWSPRTIKTMLNRLVRKGALAFQPQGKSYLYRPAVAREQCVRSESHSFLSRVFGGAAGPMLIRFVSEARLTPQEVEQLKDILKRKEK